MPTKRRQIKKKILTNRKRNIQKKTLSRKKKTKRNRNNRKFRTRYNKKNVGGGDWIDNDTIPKEDVCPICLQQFSETPELAVYETTCGHKFHNNCLNRTCDTAERAGNDLVCPICRADLETEKLHDCTDVWAFANEALDTTVLDAKNLALYEGKPPIKITRINDHDNDDIV
jgi:hypothetical protein